MNLKKRKQNIKHRFNNLKKTYNKLKKLKILKLNKCNDNFNLSNIINKK